MVTAEDAGLGHFRMAQDHVQFLEEAPRCQGGKRSIDDILVERYFAGDDERQGAEHGRVDGRYDLGRMQGMFLGPFLAAQAEAEAILQVQQATAQALKLLNEAAPNDQVVKLKALETMTKVADGKATKIIIPSELQGLAGLAASAKTVFESEEPKA
mgnify:CR=1 FL=1